MTIFCSTLKTKIKNLMLRPTQIKNNSCITPLYKHGKKEDMWDASGGGLGCKATATLEAPRRLAQVQGDSHTGSSPGGGLGPATELHFTRMHSSHATPANRQVTWMKKTHCWSQVSHSSAGNIIRGPDSCASSSESARAANRSSIFLMVLVGSP